MAVGILGGVGPAATVNFMETLLEETPAERDQDHVPTIVHNDPTIPDRTDAIRGEDDVRDHLVANARALDRTGVDAIVIASNLTHYWFEDVASAVEADCLHMIEAVGDEIDACGHRRVGVVTTTTARDVGLYDPFVTEAELVYPDSMDVAMESIYAYKAGRTREAERTLEDVRDEFTADVDAIVLGCTEFSAMGWPGTTPTLDPVEILSRRVVERYAGL